jgi:hypothetical protein
MAINNVINLLTMKNMRMIGVGMQLIRHVVGCLVLDVCYSKA